MKEKSLLSSYEKAERSKMALTNLRLREEEEGETAVIDPHTVLVLVCACTILIMDYHTYARNFLLLLLYKLR